MKRFLFYTEEGYTVAPDNQPLDNLQILGIESGTTPQSAIQKLLDNNPWIKSHGFHIGKIQFKIIAE